MLPSLPGTKLGEGPTGLWGALSVEPAELRCLPLDLAGGKKEIGALLFLIKVKTIYLTFIARKSGHFCQAIGVDC